MAAAAAAAAAAAEAAAAAAAEAAAAAAEAAAAAAAAEAAEEDAAAQAAEGAAAAQTSDAEMMVLRSAARLFAARKIERVIFEISLKRWGKFGVDSKKAGLDELKKLFEGWTCTWACNGRLFPWTPVARREVYCAPPWNEYSDLGWGLFDVYCVAPGVDPVWNATHS